MTLAVKRTIPIKQQTKISKVIFQAFLTVDAQNHYMKSVRKNIKGYQ